MGCTLDGINVNLMAVLVIVFLTVFFFILMLLTSCYV